MEVIDGEVVTQEKEEIIDFLVEDAAEFFDTEFSGSETTAVRTFYLPVANKFVDLQEKSSVILQSAQLENAEGGSLEFLTSLIGVNRQKAERATGHVEFYREEPSEVRGYSIPSGTMVRTDTDPSVVFETTESATLEQGETEVTVPVEAIDPGTQANVASQTITVIRSDLPGIEGVINPEPTDGGQEEEDDDDLRQRAEDSITEGSRATANALITNVLNIDGVVSVILMKNEDGELGELPGWEMVVQGGDEEEIAQTIAENMAAGDTAYGGNYGDKVEEDVRLENGQDWKVEFSRPEQVDIYVEATVVKTEKYYGEDYVINNIVDYIGGDDTEGKIVKGDLGVSDDVIHGEIEFAIREIDGVYDVEDLKIGTEDPPESDSNITIEDFQVSTTSGLENIQIESEDL